MIHVRDGDTIEVGGVAIRLEGIAAPERNTELDEKAAEAMTVLVLGREIACKLSGKRANDRCVGVCYLKGDDVGEIMIRRGFARACPRFSDDRYIQAERRAAADGARIGRIYRLPGYCLRR